MKVNIKHIVLFLYFLILFYPLMVQYVDLIPIKPLRGYFIVPEEVSWSLETWKTGEFQTQKEALLKFHLRIRPVLVRVYNQLRYWLYSELSAVCVVKGKDGYYYETGYINSYLGKDFIGEEMIQTKLKQFQILSDTLEKHQVKMLLIIAPGKAYVLPEYLPEEIDTHDRKITNYEVFKKELNQMKIRYIDFNSLFISAKDTLTYPLYPKGGTHWSTYGSLLAFDSIINQIEMMLGYPLSTYHYPYYETSKKPRGSDRDIALANNLVFYKNDQVLLYPYPEIIETKNKPSLLTIGDSYYWTIVNTGILKHFFSEFNFWYYFKENHAAPSGEPFKVEDFPNLKKEIEKRDIILVMITEGNLHGFSWDFVETVSTLYGIK